MKYFGRTLLSLGALLMAALVVFGGCLNWRFVNTRRAEALSKELNQLREMDRKLAEDASRRNEALRPVRRFLQSWEPHCCMLNGEPDQALALRTKLESLAQRRLGLVTDQVLLPDPVRAHVGRRSRLVQRVSLRASGEGLSTLLTWLGEAEAAFPYAHIEAWELVPGVGSGCSLSLTLSQPVSVPASRPNPVRMK